MSVRGVLDLAGRILALVDEPVEESGAPQVTSARVDDLGQAIDLLDPALRAIGGTVLDVGLIAAEGCANTVSDVGQETAICASLEHSAAGGTRALAFDDDEHRRRAFWAEERSEGKSKPSVHPLLGLATATIDERLTSSPSLVVVFYDEAQLEPVEQPLAWRYATQIMPQHLPGPIAHLVVVVAAERPRSHQLHGDPSLRWSVDGAGVAQRNHRTTNSILTQRLLAANDSHLVLFLAAGFSQSMEMPLGNKMRDYALRRLLPGRPSVPDAELPREFYALVMDQGRLLELEDEGDLERLARELTFERVLREEMRTFSPSPTLAELHRLEEAALGAAPIGALRHLKSMLRGERKLIILTVNYDRLIENGEDDHVEAFADDADFARCATYVDHYLAGEHGAAKVPLLKLHGSFSARETLVASIEQTLTGLTRDKANALDRVCQPTGLGPVPFVYVGSSMRDLDLSLQLGQPRFATQLDERWVMPLPAASVAAFVHERRLLPWRTAGTQATLHERLISWTADEFMENLAASWS